MLFHQKMFRRHPLTNLLLIASILIDVAICVSLPEEVLGRPWLSLRHPWAHLLRSSLSGLLLGQTAALAYWAVWGTGQRLARVSTMVVATCLIGLATGGYALLNRYQWMTVLFTYTVCIYAASTFMASTTRYLSKKKGPSEQQANWQISLIEMFGWTILVAIASFAGRSMDFRFLQSNDHVIAKIAAMLVLPLCLAGAIRSRLDSLTQSRRYWTCFTILLVSLVIAFREIEPRIALPLILSQVGFLMSWFTVMGMDRLMREAKAIQQSLTDELQGQESVEEDGSDQLDA